MNGGSGGFIPESETKLNQVAKNQEKDHHHHHSLMRERECVYVCVYIVYWCVLVLRVERIREVPAVDLARESRLGTTRSLTSLKRCSSTV